MTAPFAPASLTAAISASVVMPPDAITGMLTDRTSSAVGVISIPPSNPSVSTFVNNILPAPSSSNFIPRSIGFSPDLRVHPSIMTSPPAESSATMICSPPNSSASCLTNSGFLSAAVLTITRSTPIPRRSRASSIDLMPPPIWTGTLHC
ncbi:MAG: hypothetical protein C5S47_02800 [Candidatus Methanogasteraceae archaeon]|nr:MAG: hypothetical protein C5S47_02800 [ANME-2 cluster archaeon]